MAADEKDRFDSNFLGQDVKKIEEIFSKNTVLYFPPNRFEEPAWLNEENLLNQAEYVDLKRIQGYTSRKVINYSPLHENRNWLFDVAYDRAVFEALTVNVPVSTGATGSNIQVPALLGYDGNATRVFDIALDIVRQVMKDRLGTRFGIGRRLGRVVSLLDDTGQIVSECLSTIQRRNFSDGSLSDRPAGLRPERFSHHQRRGHPRRGGGRRD